MDELDTLTGPGDAEHTGLFVSTGVLSMKSETDDLSDDQALDRQTELRAVTIALTDRLAAMLRKELDVEQEQLPLSCILEGGTSRAGAAIISENRELREKLEKIMNPGSIFWLPFGA